MEKLILAYTAAIIFTGKYHVPYNINGKDDNIGTAIEVAIKSALGLDEKKDGNGAFDEVDDIPEFNASVKGNAATLTSKPLGNSFDEVTQAYFERVHSRSIWYGVLNIEEKTITIYKMNHAEFRQYLKLFSRYDPRRKVIRLNKDAISKNLHWLEQKARA